MIVAMNQLTVSDRELEILDILWNSIQPMTAKDIQRSNPSLAMSTIQNILKKLLSRKIIQVDDIIQSGKVLTRSYVPALSKEELIIRQYSDLKLPGLITAFLGQQSDSEIEVEIKEIEELLKKRESNNLT